MKAIFKLCAMTALVMLFGQGCSEISSEVKYDIAPITSYIYVYDNDGNNLLSPDSGSDKVLEISNVKAVFDGQAYAVNHVYGEDSMSDYFGLRLDKDLCGNWMLKFGDIDGTEYLDNKDLILDWGDGSTNTITFFNFLKWEKDGTPSITRRFYLDGKQLNNTIAKFTFTK